MAVRTLSKAIFGQFSIAENFCEQSRTDSFTRMNWNHRDPAIGMRHDKMAPLFPSNHESMALEDANDSLSGERRPAGHTAIR